MSQSLFDEMSSIESCTRFRLDDAIEVRGHHRVLVCDLEIDTTVQLANTKSALTRCQTVPAIPILFISDSDRALERAGEIGATAVIPRRAAHAQIVFTIRRLIEGALVGQQMHPPDLTPVEAARIREAGSHFTEILVSARDGRALSLDAVERGGNAIVAAVSGSRIGPWIDAVHTYDDLTYQHCLLVAGLATAFAKHLGISLAGQRLFAQAGLLHDVGKVKIPAHIINKPGRLTSEEMDIVRRHPVIGHEMLVAQGGFDPRKLDIVLHHHEFMNGSGYPHGLVGDQISPLVRLMTIADIYAALIERRSYKPAMPLTEALAIMQGMDGKLDPALMVAFDAFVRRN